MNKKIFGYSIMFGIILLYFCAMLSVIMSDGANMNYLIWHGGTAGVFPDLMQTVYESKGFHPYISGSIAIYPPLTYLICSILAHAIPGELNFNSSLTPNGILVLTLFFVITTCVIIIIMNDNLIIEKKYKLIIMMLFILSAPSIYMYERGNTVLLSVAFCCYFVLHYDSGSKTEREIALICLGIAASLKLYPALLGLLLLVDKKYKESVRCIIYGVGIFALTTFFEGGINELKGMIDGIKYFQTETIADQRNFGYGFKVSITNWVFAIGEYLNIDTSISSTLNSVLIIFICLMILCAIIFTHEKWKKVTASLLFLVLVPTFSWIYNVCYMLGGCILFINFIHTKEKISIKNIIFAILFTGMFVPLPYGEVLVGLHGVNKISVSTMVSSISLLLMAILLFVDGFEQLRRRNNN